MSQLLDVIRNEVEMPNDILIVSTYVAIISIKADSRESKGRVDERH